MELDDESLLERINYLEKDLQAIPDIFPLLPNIPKVSDVLAWLSTLHIQIGKKSKGELPNAQSIQIENFNYTLVKRPEQNKKQEKYLVKVEIEFTSPTPKQAREFHDALIAPNNFVDPKGEVKWNTSHGRYRASFYLKDRTVYPSST
jgi:type IV pilus assembly protein PilM